MLRRALISLALLAATSAYSSADSADLAELSVSQLLKNPEKYDGQLIEIVGRAELQFEGDSLYPIHPSEADARESPIWLELPLSIANLRCRFDGSTVRVRGRFKLGRTGHFGAYDSGISEVSLFEFKRAADKESARTDCALRIIAIVADDEKPQVLLSNGQLELRATLGSSLSGGCRVASITGKTVSIKIPDRNDPLVLRVGEAIRGCP